MIKANIHVAYLRGSLRKSASGVFHLIHLMPEKFSFCATIGFKLQASQNSRHQTGVLPIAATVIKLSNNFNLQINLSTTK